MGYSHGSDFVQFPRTGDVQDHRHPNYYRNPELFNDVDIYPRPYTGLRDIPNMLSGSDLDGKIHPVHPM